MQVEILNQTPVLMGSVVLQDIESPTEGEKETVIVLPNKNQIKVVNEVGSFVMHLIDGKRRVAEIIQEVQQAYAASPEQIKSDVLAFIQQLVSKEIITLLSDQV